MFVFFFFDYLKIVMRIFNFELLNVTTHFNKKIKKQFIVKSIHLLLYSESKIVTFSKLYIINSLNIATFEIIYY